MSLSELDEARLREYAFAAADLMVSTDAGGRISHASGDAGLFHYPSSDRLIGKDALDLISESEAGRLREDLWALAPGRRIAWEDSGTIEGARRIVVQRNAAAPNTFSFLISRRPNSSRLRGDGQEDMQAERFRDAVMNGRLMAARQPVVETRSGAISHYEVLARFSGEDSPIGLISAAERSGQISHLDYIMVSAAIARLTDNQDPAFRLAVNISGESIQRIEVVREFCALVSGHEFRRDRLILEVTESAQIRDIETAARSVSMLRDSGVSVSLDDFGAGAASFGYLRALEVDGLKFDGSFLQSPELNFRSLALMRNVARMCAELGIASVGERVETETERRLLLEAGVRYAQGYLFGAPVIDEDFFVRRPRALRRAA
jgi:EAL domain-containing protein (putative c-di-GMP-specific phosphodiesterase class I)